MNISGHNDSVQNQSLKGLLVPQASEVALLFVVSLLLLLLLNASVIWMLLTDSSQLTTQTASQSIQPQLDAITAFFQRDIFGKASLFVIWAFVGCLAYAVVGGLQHFAWRVKEDVDQSKYVRPATVHTYWYTRLAQYGYFASVVFLTTIFAILFVAWLLPMATEMAETTIRNFTDPAQYGYFLAGILLVMVCLYVLLLLWRATRYSFHITFAKIQS